ncbi:3'-5' exonuclease [Fodinicurvata sediminis]|uniref:3'-5' exonuclease n=1 Tax=Fodinicurvata sediminis TaxID=1121832 RepID=UPI0003B73AEB|nr:3'-5' exonuclease [Fodinicurvata sediminis]
MLLFFCDFETNGLPLFDQPSNDPRQPHIVQAAATLVEAESRKVVSSLNLISCPDGWEIPDEAAQVHGITTEYALQVGIPEDKVAHALHALWRQAHCRIAHNESFDARIMRIALKRFLGNEAADFWKSCKAECTQRLATPIVKAAPSEKMMATGRKHTKTASLAEAYAHFMGRPLQNAHTALADVKGCMEVYFAIQGQVPGATPAADTPAAPPPKKPEPEPAQAGDDGLSFLS